MTPPPLATAAGPTRGLDEVAAAWCRLATSSGADWAQAFVQDVCDLRVETANGVPEGLVVDRRAGVGMLVRRGDAWSYRWADLADTDDLASWLGRGPAPKVDNSLPLEEDHLAGLRAFVDDLVGAGVDEVEGADDAHLTEELFHRRAWIADSDGVAATTHRTGVRRRCTITRPTAHGDVRGFGRWYGAPGVARGPGVSDIVATAARQAEAAARGRSLGSRTTPVLFGPGVGAGLVHELLAHGLEADNHRAAGSYLGGRLGQRVAPEALSVVDDPSWVDGYGSLEVDDEGIPARRVGLVVDGVVQGLVHSRRTAQEGSAEPTGHGRRRDYRHRAVPRATNTVVCAGPEDAAALAEPGLDGLLRVHALGSGTVDTRSGEFQFMATEAELVTPYDEPVPLCDVMIRGGALDVLQRLIGVAGDLGADNTTCSKDGQYVGVGTVSPTMLFDDLEWRS